MPSDTSSVIVLPINVAPASSSHCTAQACRVGTGFHLAQSGLPPPVGWPATSNRSLAANVRPESRPPARPSIRTRGPGTKALISSDMTLVSLEGAVPDGGRRAGEGTKGLGHWRCDAEPRSDLDDRIDEPAQFERAAGLVVLQHRGAEGTELGVDCETLLDVHPRRGSRRRRDRRDFVHCAQGDAAETGVVHELVYPRAGNHRERVERGIADELGPDLASDVVGYGYVESALLKHSGDLLGPLAARAEGFAEDEFVAAGPPHHPRREAGDAHIDDGADYRAGGQRLEQCAVRVDRGDPASPERPGQAVEVPPRDAVDRRQECRLRSDQRGQRGKGDWPVLRFHRPDHQILRSELGRVIGDVEPDDTAAVPFLDMQPVPPDRSQRLATGDQLWCKPGAGQREGDGAADGTGADDRDRKGIRHGVRSPFRLLGCAICWCKSTRSRPPKKLAHWLGLESIISGCWSATARFPASCRSRRPTRYSRPFRPQQNASRCRFPQIPRRWRGLPEKPGPTLSSFKRPSRTSRSR